ncbi:MAG: leucine-rich repeat domain-containing protein, partial [Muribaculaceae bacterium]|nr:leucine-rich repeat domain-containing protein [Muribaculaceae bacterium]
MKKLLLTMLGAVLALPALAQDFEYTYEGQTITYTIIDEDAKTCMTKQGDYGGAGNLVEGELVIPSIAKDGDTEYTVTSIGRKSFFNCSNLTSVAIHNPVISIDEEAFSQCYRLASVEIPASVESIGYRAFQNCEALTAIEIPASVISFGNEVFTDCRKLTSIEVSAENPNYASVDGVMFNKDLSTLIQFPGGNTEYVIPNSVTSIGNGAFNCCRYLRSIEIPNSVTSIGDKAFNLCSSLATIEIPNSVIYIGNSAFYSCDGLTSVKIPNSVTSLGEMAFYM